MKKVITIGNKGRLFPLNSFFSMGNIPNYLLRIFPDIRIPVIKEAKPKAVITAVIRKTAGGRHAWCESDRGIIRKPLNSIPSNLL